MMEKRRTIGVTAFGFGAIFIGIFCFRVLFTILIPRHAYLLARLPKGYVWWVITSAPILGILYIASGMGLLWLKPWARKLCIALAAYDLLGKVISVCLGITQQTPMNTAFAIYLYLFLYAFVIYYFTHPKVKEQFESGQRSGKLAMRGRVMPETESIERLCNPYAKRLLMIFLIGAALVVLAYYSRFLEAFRVVLAYLAPFLVAYATLLAVTLYRHGNNPVPPKVLIAGIVFVIGGVALDVVATIMNTPTLTREVNPVVRALLGSGHSVGFVYVYGLIAQALFATLICVLWAAFLRHRITLISSAMNTQPKSRLEFLKAATGGGHLSWRQYCLPLKLSEMPTAYHVIWLLAAILTGGQAYRWYLGLSWLGLVRGSDVSAMIISATWPVIAYSNWLWFQYSEEPEPTVK